MLDDITLYWLTNTGTSSSRSYWDAAQGGGGPFNAFDIPKVPVAVTVFPGEIYRAPRSWAEQSFHKLIYWNEVDKGGHFAAWEQPELFAEIRAAFRSLRDEHLRPARQVGSARHRYAPKPRGHRGRQARHRPRPRRIRRRDRMAARDPVLEKEGYNVTAVQNPLARSPTTWRRRSG